MGVERIAIEPTFRRESGLFIIDIDKVELPEGFDVEERFVVYIPPGQIGGNHKHPRKEIFIGLGDLELVWKDEGGEVHTEKMGGEELKMFVVEPMVPHTVKNNSKNEFGVLIEFATEKQHDVEETKLV